MNHFRSKISGHFSAHFWFLKPGFGQIYLTRNRKAEENLREKLQKWSKMWSNARFLPTFKTWI